LSLDGVERRHTTAAHLLQEDEVREALGNGIRVDGQ
jgi:hypothetical protein